MIRRDEELACLMVACLHPREYEAALVLIRYARALRGALVKVKAASGG